MSEQGTSIPTINRPVAEPPAAHTEPQQDISIACYDGEIPAFVDMEMRRLYGNIHSTLAHLQIYGGLEEVTHTYVARRQNKVVAVFLFRRDGDVVRVINEGMGIGTAQTQGFADYVFSTWPEVNVIVFHAVQAAIAPLALPSQRYDCTANIVLPLPASGDAYLATLGKNMRRNLRRYMDKLTRSFPDFRFEVFEKEQVDEDHVRDIIDLNRARIAGKNKTFGIADEEDRILALVRASGLVGVATIDGRVAGGAVGYLAGDHYFFKIIAHDPKYDEYSAGILCCYQMICACIARGCKEYNFMWNEYEYKFALGAHSRALQHVVVYRSRLQFLLHARMAAGVALDRHRHRLSSLLDKAAKPEQLGRGTRLAIGMLNAMRRVKRFAARLRGRRV